MESVMENGMEVELNFSEDEWDLFLQEVQKRPKPPEKKSKEEIARERERRDSDRLVREIGEMRNRFSAVRTDESDESHIAVRAKIIPTPQGEMEVEFYIGKRNVVTIGYQPDIFRSRNLYNAEMPLFLVKPELEYTGTVAWTGNDGTKRVGVAKENWKDMVRWIDDTMDMQKVAALAEQIRKKGERWHGWIEDLTEYRILDLPDGNNGYSAGGHVIEWIPYIQVITRPTRGDGNPSKSPQGIAGQPQEMKCM